MKRNEFVRLTGPLRAGPSVSQNIVFGSSYVDAFPTVRILLHQRKFGSKAAEEAISAFTQKVSNKELACLLENCFPNTVDTTVDFEMIDGKPDKYFITDDIDGMWVGHSTAQVRPCRWLIRKDKQQQQLIAGVISWQAKTMQG